MSDSISPSRKEGSSGNIPPAEGASFLRKTFRFEARVAVWKSAIRNGDKVYAIGKSYPYSIRPEKKKNNKNIATHGNRAINNSKFLRGCRRRRITVKYV